MSALAINTERKYSVEEYFALLGRSEDRYEYHAGQIRMMAGGTSEHNKIKFDTGLYLGAESKGKSCEPYDSDMAVFLPKWESYVFPDLSFVCEEAQFEDDAKCRLLNPNLLIEVISESSEAYDRGEKFQKYRSLESFREYMLIDSRRYSVECWYKEDEKIWRIDSAFDREGSVHLYTLDLDLPLAEIYRRVTFAEDQ